MKRQTIKPPKQKLHRGNMFNADAAYTNHKVAHADCTNYYHMRMFGSGYSTRRAQPSLRCQSARVARAKYDRAILEREKPKQNAHYRHYASDQLSRALYGPCHFDFHILVR